MKFTLPIDITNMDVGDQDLVRAISVTFAEMTRIINGNIGLTDNLQTTLVTVTFNAKDTSQAISHLLNRQPIGYFQVGAKAACDIYDGTQANTSTALYVRSTVATTVRLLVF